jgi:hypothetical protein
MLKIQILITNEFILIYSYRLAIAVNGFSPIQEILDAFIERVKAQLRRRSPSSRGKIPSNLLTEMNEEIMRSPWFKYRRQE